MCNPSEEKGGMEAINKLKSADPPLFLSPNPDLSLSSRIASQHLFTSLKSYTPKSPLDKLLTNGFDAEQIWQQIDLQSHPLISSLKREVSRFEKNPNQILSHLAISESNGVMESEIKENNWLEGESYECEGLSDDDDDDDEQEEEEEENQGIEAREKEEGEDEDKDEEEGDEDEDEDDSIDEFDEADGVPEVEDEFLKIKDLEKYLVQEEEREYGYEENKSKKKKGKTVNTSWDDEDTDNEEDEEEQDQADDEFLLYGDDNDDEDGFDANIRYEDFFVPDKKMPKKKRNQTEKSNGSETEDEDDDHKKRNLSTHEKERKKIQTKIKEMEEANLGPKDWTMLGEVTAAKRPKDSALEVDLDFEHNVRPPPVITEEFTTSLEEKIKKRILEGNFDNVKRAPKLSTAVPREIKELDDNKSKKGLAEIYEEEYAQQTGLSSTPLSSDDGLKKEASKLMKTLFLKLDALCHFHFAPKPVVEEMCVQAIVPALAMEEIAPVAVSDAAMLAPEEIFAGKGDLKEETELTKEDRKRRRARKKRKFKAVKAKRAGDRDRASEKPSQVQSEGNEK